MNEYESLRRKWSELFGSLDRHQQNKLRDLLRVEGEKQTRSNVELLLSLDDCACVTF